MSRAPGGNANDGAEPDSGDLFSDPFDSLDLVSGSPNARFTVIPTSVVVSMPSPPPMSLDLLRCRVLVEVVCLCAQVLWQHAVKHSVPRLQAHQAYPCPRNVST